MGQIPDAASDVASALGDYLRMLRRLADASQREMAARSGVPLSTIAGIESGRVRDIQVRTMARLAGAGDCSLVLLDDRGAVVAPHREQARDLGGRRLPAHLDVRPWVPEFDWIPQEHGPFTFDRNRRLRDERRLRSQQRDPVPLRTRLLVERLEKWLGTRGWAEEG